MAITLHLPSSPSREELKRLIEEAFPHYKLKTPPLNPNALMVQNGASMVLVTRRANGIKIAGGVNTANVGIALGVGIGVLLGFIGALIFLLIVYASNQDTFKRMEQEVAGVVRQEWGKQSESILEKTDS